MGKNKFKKKGGETLDERRKRLKAAAKEIAAEKSGKATKAKFSIDQLLDKAQDCIDKFEYELAQKFCQRALEMEADNVRALETSGSLLVDLGKFEAAKQCYGRAVTVCPNSGYSKYMNLGQLFEGAQAVDCYQKGIELMLAEKEQRESKEVAAACGGGEEGASPTDRDISNSYLSIAELYMTDCCFEEEAEQKCQTHIQKAIDIDKDNPDAHQLMASFLISKEKTDEARETIKKSVSLWLPDFQASSDRPEPGPSTSSEPTPDVTECPQSFESRLAAGKILIEVQEYEMALEVLETLLEEDDKVVEMALEVLETLLEEDDEVVEVWYLLGWASHLAGDEEGKQNARGYLTRARRVARKTRCPDEEMMKHVDELLQGLGTGEAEMDSDQEEELEDLDQAEQEILQSDDDEEEEEEEGEAMDH